MSLSPLKKTKTLGGTFISIPENVIQEDDEIDDIQS